MDESLRLEPLGAHHARAAFACTDEPSLQDYIRDGERAIREHVNGVTRVYVLVAASMPNTIIGYVTLSNATVLAHELPNKVKRGLPLYKLMPAMLLGRMAVDDNYRGHDYGALLVLKSFALCLKAIEIAGCVALLVDPKTDRLISYYANSGFTSLRDQRRMFIMKTAMEDVLREANFPLE